MQPGYALLAANPAVIHWAVKQLGLFKQSAEYEDYLRLGEARYLFYFDRMHPAVATAAQQAAFNHQVAWRIYRDLKRRLVREGRRAQLEKAAPQPPTTTAIDTTQIEVRAVLAALWPRLTPGAQQVLRLRFDAQLTNREIAALMGLSVQRVSQLAQQLQRVYKQLEAE
ncbi:MAG: hypothetical protein LKJ69_09670 [Lactobacillus sp.]|jgi:RNA polymerase sigma factor (sigma-70 family)|nr:hypothetical protein [Lactobacillus sp.]MCI2033629.1 hypothetical protein [Lactobacillus sp.]